MLNCGKLFQASPFPHLPFLICPEASDSSLRQVLTTKSKTAKNNCVAECQKLWKCYEFLPNQCFVNIPKVTRVNVPLTVLIVYHVPLWYKKTNRVSILRVSHTSCTKNCLNELEVFQLTLSCSLKYIESWGLRRPGGDLVPAGENWKACIWSVTVSASGLQAACSRGNMPGRRGLYGMLTEP